MWRLQRQWSRILMLASGIAKRLGAWNAYIYLHGRACHHYDETLVPESREGASRD